MIIEIIKNDITTLAVDAIVNAANTSWLGGGGVDGAIHRVAGRELYEACKKFNGCKTGEARITPGFNLPAQFVIHTPGPIWQDGRHNEAMLLKQCYFNSLCLANAYQCKKIAFSCISTGVYRFPKEEAANIAISTVQEWIGSNPQHVIFCCFSDSMVDIYQKILNNN